jgi:hypothetical protein
MTGSNSTAPRFIGAFAKAENYLSGDNGSSSLLQIASAIARPHFSEAKHAEAELLLKLSDDELRARGLTRAGIYEHVFGR